MANEMKDLFDHWELVWHEAQYDLIPVCVGSQYTRHDEAGDRTVTREAYTAELKAIHKGRPSIRVVVYDHLFSDGFALHSSGPTKRPGNPGSERVCSRTGSKAASSQKLGSRCSR